MSAADPRASLAADGVALVREAVAPEVLDDLRTALAACRSAGVPMSRQVLYTHGPAPAERPPLSALMDQWLNPHRRDGPCSTRAAADAMRALVRGLLGEEPVLFQDLLLVKRQGQRRFPWHQDFPYWPVDRPDGVVLWVPLQASDGTSGALHFAPGSHRLGPRPVVDLHDGAPQDRSAGLGFSPEHWPSFDPTYAPGDAVAFSPVTFHASPAMERSVERAAWSCIFLSPHVRWSHERAPNHPLCRIVPDGAPVHEVPLA